MKKLNFLILFLFLVFLSSCLTLKESITETKALSNSKYNLLDGTYSENIEKQNFYTLADLLIVNYQRQFSLLEKNDSLHCRLKMLNENQLKVEILKNNTLISRDTLKGEIKNNYFFLEKQKYVDKTDGKILFYKEKIRTRIGILSNGDLTIDSISRFDLRLLYIPIDIEDTIFVNRCYNRIS